MVDQDKFAAGSNRVDGVNCPIRAAGYNPDAHDWTRAMAEAYDLEAQVRCEREQVVLSETEARDAFMSAIAKMRKKTHLEVAEIAEKKVAEELGWV